MLHRHGASATILLLVVTLALTGCRPDDVVAEPPASPPAQPAPTGHHHTPDGGDRTPGTPASPASAAASAGPRSSSPTGAADGDQPTVSSGGTLTNPAPGNGLPATIDVPQGAVGFDTQRVRPITGDLARSGLDVGAFRVTCDYSHLGFDDPIVKPNQPGASHLHTFFGNTQTSASSTPDSIADSGRSTCAGGTANRSAYWVPTLYDTGSGKPIIPSFMIVYYKTGYNGVRPQDVVAPPARLRMVAGDVNASARQPHAGWGCVDGTKVDRPEFVPTECPAGKEAVTLHVVFPQCWNGKDLDSADHQSHMAYPYGSGGGCPASHPVAIPEITINLRFDLKTAGESRSWRLSSDRYDPELPGGRSLHGDWMNGWEPTIEDAWVDNCNHKAMDCSYQLGDGRELF